MSDLILFIIAAPSLAGNFILAWLWRREKKLFEVMHRRHTEKTQAVNFLKKQLDNTEEARQSSTRAA